MTTRPHWWDSAVHFGHAAREAYQRFADWTAELEHELERDWKKLHAQEQHDWEEIRHAVKEGWERKATSSKPPRSPGG
jgi:hypothetical protein